MLEIDDYDYNTTHRLFLEKMEVSGAGTWSLSSVRLSIFNIALKPPVFMREAFCLSRTEKKILI